MGGNDTIVIPDRQRALVLQGGGALGAYDAGVFQALNEKIPIQDEQNGENDRPLFDIVAGTSSGAMNAAILVSHVIEKKTWKGSADKLNAFWDYLSANPNIDLVPGFNNWWENWHEINSNIATEEAARKYYSVKEFLYTGIENVFSPSIPRYDTKFFDPLNTWYVYNNQRLKESLEKFAKFPIATTSSKNRKQPRLLLVTVDVMEAATVTFDSYENAPDGSRASEYGEYNNYTKQNGSKKKELESSARDEEPEYQYIIKYDGGIKSDYVMASASVPLGYDYTKLDVEERLTTVDPNITRSSSVIQRDINNYRKTQRYFWDGGILSNTPLRELLEAHRNYWFKLKNEDSVPGLDVYIVDVWPSKEKDIPFDYDGVKNRQNDIMLSDKTVYDEKIADIVSDYIKLAKDLLVLAKNNSIPQNYIDSILLQNAKSNHRTGKPRIYNDLIKGRFDTKVMRIERKNNVNDISNKLLDYSADTITEMRDDGYRDALREIARQ